MNLKEMKIGQTIMAERLTDPNGLKGKNFFDIVKKIKTQLNDISEDLDNLYSFFFTFHLRNDIN